MSEHDLDRVIPPDLRAAIADGWEGVTLLADAPAEQPVTVVCAARAGRLDRMGGCAFTVADAAAGGAPGRLLVLAIEEEREDGERSVEDGCPPMSVGIDLAYPEARALVERACAAGGMRIAWVPAGGDAAELPRCQAIELGASGCAELRAAMARVAEWHTGAPVPLGVSASAWAEARRSPPRLVEGSFAEGRVALVVPARTLWGVESQGGRVAFASSLIGAHGPRRRPPARRRAAADPRRAAGAARRRPGAALRLGRRGVRGPAGGARARGARPAPPRRAPGRPAADDRDERRGRLGGPAGARPGEPRTARAQPRAAGHRWSPSGATRRVRRRPEGSPARARIARRFKEPQHVGRGMLTSGSPLAYRQVRR